MRKILGFITLMLTIFLVSCDKISVEDQLFEELSIMYIAENDNANHVTSNIGLKTEIAKFPEAEIVWESTNENVIKVKENIGVVTRLAKDTKVDLIANVSYKNLEVKFTFNLTVIGIGEEDIDLDEVLNGISLPSEVTENLELVTNVSNVTITWVSNNTNVISDEGIVTRLAEDVTVTLTATASLEGKTANKEFEVLVIGTESNTKDLNAILNTITLEETVTTNLNLPHILDGVAITWESNNIDTISNEGVVVRGNNDVTVTLTATATFENQEASKTFTVKVLKFTEAPESTETPIIEVRQKSKGTNVTVHGVVTSHMSNGGYSIEDSTGAISIYAGSNQNSFLKVGNEYIISGVIDEFNGLVQIVSPKIEENLGVTEFPSSIDLTGFSLEFEDVVAYEAHVITYRNLEVTAITEPNNAYEIIIVNEDNEESMVRLDKRVNDSNKLLGIEVGEIIDLENVTIGQYQGKAQFMFTNRSVVTSRPKDPNKPEIYGAKNITYVIGVTESINYLEGVTAKNANGIDFTNKLEVDTSMVDLTEYGNYDVTILLPNIPGYGTISQTIKVYVRNEAQVGVYEGYYESLSGLVGEDFNNQLRRLIQNTGLSNEGSTNNVKAADNYNGKNYNIYTGFGGYGNREHVWPNSKLGSAPKYDLHNLRAAVISVNSSRSNYPFADKPGEYTGSRSYERMGSTWYPGDEHIGDVARIVLYISVRYNLNLNLVGNLEMFLRWHELDPVSDFELVRNDNIQNIQKNRNPFIDHPELVNIYFGYGAN